MKNVSSKHKSIPTARLLWGACLCAVLCLSAAALAIAGSPRDEALWRCPYTSDGCCPPNVRAFGYYPTTWRRWPEPHSKPPEEKKYKSAVKPPEKPAEPADAGAMPDDKDEAPIPPTEQVPAGQLPPPTGEQPPAGQLPAGQLPEMQAPPAQGAPAKLPTLAPNPPTTQPGATPKAPADDQEQIFEDSQKPSERSTPTTPDAKGKPADEGKKPKADPFFDDQNDESFSAPKEGDSSSTRSPDGPGSRLQWRANPIRQVVRQQEVAVREEILETGEDHDAPRLLVPSPSARPIDDNDAPPEFEPAADARPIQKTSFNEPRMSNRANPLRSADASRDVLGSRPLR